MSRFFCTAKTVGYDSQPYFDTATHQTGLIYTTEYDWEQIPNRELQNKTHCNYFSVFTAVQNRSLSKERQRSNFTESQNSRGWEGPLWII